jgi:malonyl CoA-acyl carrier protein transacylase
MAACSAGRSLGEAAAEATLAEPGLDLAALLALCLSQGALTKG